MEREGLLIGIDYSDKYCQACCYNERHARAESVSGLKGPVRYLIPSALCFCAETGQWLAGDEAAEYASGTGTQLYTDLLYHALGHDDFEINGRLYSSEELLGIYIKKILNLAVLKTGASSVGHVNITMRRTGLEEKELMERVFSGIGIDKKRVSLISYDESLPYFMLCESKNPAENGIILFDFSKEGFFVKRIEAKNGKDGQIFCVESRDLSSKFSVRDIGSDVLRPRLDDRLNELYESLVQGRENVSVYFAGTAFEELWFSETLKNVSRTGKAFRGNNIYAKGACLKGLFSDNEPVVLCRGRTKAAVSVLAQDKGKTREIVLSPAAKDWYEASGSADFILDESKTAELMITSLMGHTRTAVSFELSSFPERPPKTSRVRVSVRYISENECEVCITDMGLGCFFAPSGKKVRKILDLEGYV